MKDLQNRNDVIHLITYFYEMVKADELLGPIFEMPSEVWENHLPRMYNFWENWLFDTRNYDGGLMWVHHQVHAKTPLTVNHFERWLGYFFIALDENFQGPKANFAKNKALELGRMMLGRLG